MRDSIFVGVMTLAMAGIAAADMAPPPEDFEATQDGADVVVEASFADDWDYVMRLRRVGEEIEYVGEMAFDAAGEIVDVWSSGGYLWHRVQVVDECVPEEDLGTLVTYELMMVSADGSEYVRNSTTVQLTDTEPCAADGDPDSTSAPGEGCTASIAGARAEYVAPVVAGAALIGLGAILVRRFRNPL